MTLSGSIPGSVPRSVPRSVPLSILDLSPVPAGGTAADALLITTITTDHVDRVRSTELLARAWAEQAGVRAGWSTKEAVNKAKASVVR